MEESILGSSIVEAMQTRDHNERSCPVFHNCLDMWCMKEHPDQAKIFYIQSSKHSQPEELQGMLLDPLKLGGVTPDNMSLNSSGAGGKRVYTKTPKHNKVDEDIEEEV